MKHKTFKRYARNKRGGQHYWIQNAKIKKGALKKQLGIKKEDKIPSTLLNKIIKSDSGDKITNPTETGDKKIKVTRKMERRAILARNLKNLRKKRGFKPKIFGMTDEEFKRFEKEEDIEREDKNYGSNFAPLKYDLKKKSIQGPLRTDWEATKELGIPGIRIVVNPKGKRAEIRDY